MIDDYGNDGEPDVSDSVLRNNILVMEQCVACRRTPDKLLSAAVSKSLLDIRMIRRRLKRRAFFRK